MKKKIETDNDKENVVLDQFKGAKRYISSGLSVVTDLFKLNSTTMIKDLGWDENHPIPTPMEHCHFYRTYNSNGKKNLGTNIVGGHYHEITVSVDGKGNLVAECSPPIQNKKSEKIHGKDNHIHTSTYIKSEEVELRKFNADAIKTFNMGMSEPKSDIKMESLKR